MLTFKEDTHEYFWNDKSIPSVSEILKKVGMSNFEGMDKDKLELYAQFGNAVHLCTEYYDCGDLDDSSVDSIKHPVYDFTARPLLDRWKWFVENWDVQIDKVEHQVCHLEHWFAGTIDRVAIVKGEKSIVEIKTGQPKKSHRLQTAAYSLAYGETLPRYHVYLSPNVEKAKSVQIWRNTDQDIEGFFHALELAKWKSNKKVLSNEKSEIFTHEKGGK